MLARLCFLYHKSNGLGWIDSPDFYGVLEQTIWKQKGNKSSEAYEDPLPPDNQENLPIALLQIQNVVTREGLFCFTSFFPTLKTCSSKSLMGMFKFISREMPSMGECCFTFKSSVTMNIAGPAINDPPSCITALGYFGFKVEACFCKRSIFVYCHGSCSLIRSGWLLQLK